MVFQIEKTKLKDSLACQGKVKKLPFILCTAFSLVVVVLLGYYLLTDITK